jgi:two-component system phosphate regulon sensor histidine kinase PhoR
VGGFVLLLLASGLLDTLEWRHVWLTALVFFALGYLPSLVRSLREARTLTQLADMARSLSGGSARLASTGVRGGPLKDVENALREAADRQERLSQQLDEERSRTDLILRRMVEGVAVIDQRQKIVFCNEAFSRALGLAGLPRAGNLLVEVSRESGLLEIVRNVLDTTQTVRAEVKLGAARSNIYSVTAAPVSGGTTPSVVLVLHDITEPRRLEQMRRDFVANVSHEFKTPLTAIQGFAETLLEGALTDRQNGPRFLQIIKDHAIRLNRLTSDLLRLSLIEAGKVVIERQQLNVHEVIQACVETVSMRAGQKKILLEAEYPPADASAWGDPSKLREILLNLLDNAIQYTPAGGKIVLGAKQAEAGTTFYVADNGIGISPADQKRIFERFYRVDDARSREVGGTGLGLSITKHLVEAHGGNISLESDGIQGSTFSVFLPIPSDAPPRIVVTQ